MICIVMFFVRLISSLISFHKFGVFNKSVGWVSESDKTFRMPGFCSFSEKADCIALRHIVNMNIDWVIPWMGITLLWDAR